MKRQIVRWLRLFVFALIAVAFVSACMDNRWDTAPTDGDTNCRAIEHVMGESCVPNQPQRVVVLHDYLALDAVVALGIQPVGAVGIYQGSSPFPPWLNDKLDGVEVVGTAQQPSLEKILQLDPDLIITLEGEGHDRLYDRLSQIAPTVVVPSERQIFPEVRFLGEVFDRADRAQALLDRYEQRLQELREAMGDRIDTLEVSLIRFLPEGVRIEGNSYNVGKILKDAGFRRPPAQQIQRPITVSLESIEKIDGDVIFANTLSSPKLQNEANRTLKRYQQHPLWSKLKAVRNDRVYYVDPELWSGNGILWTYEIIDDLFDYLVEGNPS